MDIFYSGIVRYHLWSTSRKMMELYVVRLALTYPVSKIVAVLLNVDKYFLGDILFLISDAAIDEPWVVFN